VNTKAAKEKAVGGYRSAQQSRSARTEEKFLKAAARLFAEHGYAGTRIADIIRESGCSTGSFYHRFSDKESVFHLLLEQYIDDNVSRARDYQFDKNTHESVWHLFHFFTLKSLEAVSDRRGFYMAVQELSLQDRTLMDRLKSITRLLADRFREAASLYADEIAAKDPEEAMAQACQLIVTIVWRIEAGDGLLYPDDKNDLACMLADAACGIVRAPHPKT